MLDEQNILSRLDHSLVERAAALQGKTMNDFVVSAACEVAAETIARHNLIELSVNEQNQFAEALLNPPPVAPALKRAIANNDRLFDPS